MQSVKNSLGLKKISILMILLFVLTSCGNTNEEKKETVKVSIPITNEPAIHEPTEEKQAVVVKKNFDDAKFAKAMDVFQGCLIL